MRPAVLTIAVVVLVCLPGAARSDVLLKWTFDGNDIIGGGAVDQNPPALGAAVNPRVIGTDVASTADQALPLASVTNGVQTSQSGDYGVWTWVNNNYNNGTLPAASVYSSALTKADAEANGCYFQFSVNPTPGMVVTIDDITGFYGNNGNARYLAIFTSTDGGATWTDANLVNRSISFYDSNDTTTTAISNVVEANSALVRIYFWRQAGSTGGPMQLDSLTVNGSVIPEPATMALLLGGGVALAIRARRRR